MGSFLVRGLKIADNVCAKLGMRGTRSVRGCSASFEARRTRCGLSRTAPRSHVVAESALPGGCLQRGGISPIDPGVNPNSTDRRYLQLGSRRTCNTRTPPTTSTPTTAIVADSPVGSQPPTYIGSASTPSGPPAGCVPGKGMMVLQCCSGCAV